MRRRGLPLNEKGFMHLELVVVMYLLAVLAAFVQFLLPEVTYGRRIVSLDGYIPADLEP
jgi:Tfp pilus assembly protein FimT